jgi:sensor histidine kinase regulating citrate/malate metabolism
MEEKRYEEMRAYMEATRKMRHDSRQHYLVIQDLAEKGDLEQLRDYLDQMTDYNSVTYQTYCGQPSVDAIASYYDRVGKEQKIQFSWTLQLPEKLSMNIADYCSMLGNLVENSVHAVSGLPEPQRRITVVSRMISDQMLGLCVENPYEGTILFDRDGLPRSDEPEHGIGLASVSATVHRYNGTLEITTENYIFSVNILLNLTA